VVSDTVNTAARMEGLTKHFKSGIILSDSTIRGIRTPQDFPVRPLGLVQVKGREEVLMIYESFAGDSPIQKRLKTQTLADFKAGLNAYFEQEFFQSTQAFGRVLKTNPIDPTARRYQALASRYLREGIPVDWDGIERLEQK
ncbi:MAG: adenylate/guanylate cyclase domain-containing protein, partial [Bacteroidia bacterium]